MMRAKMQVNAVKRLVGADGNVMAEELAANPVLYDLGYNNNNCVGCIKGGMGYWNHIRVDFPEVFAARAQMEREIGFPILGNKYGWLDELDPERGRHTPPIVEDCGIMCELIAI